MTSWRFGDALLDHAELAGSPGLGAGSGRGADAGAILPSSRPASYNHHPAVTASALRRNEKRGSCSPGQDPP